MKRTRIISGYLLLAVVLACAQSAQAALGGSADTITSDRKALQAVSRATASYPGYTVQEVVSAATTVREYVSPSDIVFGVAWNGNTYPDLTQLLGSYGDEYSAAQQKAERRRGHRRQRLVTDNIVVETWGHMRNLRGRAYVPGLVPTGVNLDAIQ